MVLISWRLSRGFRRFWEGVRVKKGEAILTIRSLTCHYHLEQDYIIDILLQPIFWCVDNFARYIGTIFVYCVIMFTCAVVAIAYYIGLPYWWERNKVMTVFLLIFGNWLLVNVLFHYYKGLTTSPGYPPPADEVIEAASICKKCIFPKPPRTHHCSVCDTCILAMDHHCPWLNNCVGYFNARYFFLYMVYVLLGVFFIMLAGLDIGLEVLFYYNSEDGMEDPDLEGHPVYINKSGVLIPVLKIPEYDIFMPPREHDLPIAALSLETQIAADPFKRKCVYFMFFVCLSAFLALGVLVKMHARNISKGETSIESYINESQRKKIGTSFINPYDCGRRRNWRVFLGLNNGRTFSRHVLLPSSHKPLGNGLTWKNIYDVNWDWS